MVGITGCTGVGFLGPVLGTTISTFVGEGILGGGSGGQDAG